MRRERSADSEALQQVVRLAREFESRPAEPDLVVAPAGKLRKRRACARKLQDAALQESELRIDAVLALQLLRALVRRADLA